MVPASAALLEALGDPALARRWTAAVLERGTALLAHVCDFECAQQGAVSAAQGRVQGWALYRVSLTHSPGGALRGDCDCPHAAGGQACKHQAALALAWRRHLGGEALAGAMSGPEPATEPSVKPAAEPDWARFVRQQPAAELAERLLRWAARLPELRKELQLWQQAATPVEDLAQAKKVVTTVLAAPRELWDWRQVSAYVRKAESVLGLLAGWTARDAALGLGAAEHAWLKLWKLLDAADDSNGEIQQLIVQVGELWVAALQAAGPPPAAYAERYLKLLDADDCGYLPVNAALVALGPTARERLLRLLRERWEVDPDATATPARRHYLRHLRAVQDWEEALRVLRARLQAWTDHRELIETLQAAGRAREALQAAEAAHRAHPQAAELTELLIGFYRRDGWDEQVLQLYRELFDRQPDSARYQALLQAAEAAGQPRAAERERVWRELEQRLAGATGWRESEVANLMLTLWTDEGDWASALRWLQTPRAVGETALLRLAQLLPTEHRDAAAQIFKELLTRSMRATKSPYAQPLRLVRQALQVLEPEAARLWLAWLRVEYRAKRHFIEGLPML
ncbi:SWIM zinc finger family protein [Inhella proteolytica]|uniref:SWIM-type domain-containing protein n=1 Tax=Inhella proteolytica TaxID=2795029 RepID=A0A931J591_9BURK|nr:hypothetical protein [Inhella proteolytica]MBH9578053.1 hypothetical protein [Inhella proteolytica]